MSQSIPCLKIYQYFWWIILSSPTYWDIFAFPLLKVVDVTDVCLLRYIAHLSDTKGGAKTWFVKSKYLLLFYEGSMYKPDIFKYPINWDRTVNTPGCSFLFRICRLATAFCGQPTRCWHPSTSPVKRKYCESWMEKWLLLFSNNPTYIKRLSTVETLIKSRVSIHVRTGFVLAPKVLHWKSLMETQP